MPAWTTQAWDLGGAVSYGVNEATHTPYSGVVVRFHGADAARSIIMPIATQWSNNNLFAVVCNEQAAGDITITDQAGDTLGTVSPGSASKVFLIDNSTVAGVWLVRDAGTVYT